MYREPIVVGRKLGLKSIVWTRRKKETYNQKRMKKQEFKNSEERLRNRQDIFKRSQHLNYRGTRRRRARTKK